MTLFYSGLYYFLISSHSSGEKIKNEQPLGGWVEGPNASYWFQGFQPFLRDPFLTAIIGSSENLTYNQTSHDELCVNLMWKIETQLRYFDSRDYMSHGWPSCLHVLERRSVCSGDGRLVYYILVLGHQHFKAQYIYASWISCICACPIDNLCDILNVTKNCLRCKTYVKRIPEKNKDEKICPVFSCAFCSVSVAKWGF
jgi:hypothetical protein